MNQEQNSDKTLLLKRIFWGAIVGVSAIVGMIYVFNFDSFSETEMVQFSFIWIAGLAFGIGGLQGIKAGVRKPMVIAVLAAIVSLALLFGFYVTIWPSL